jgi:hypothetical protein
MRRFTGGVVIREHRGNIILENGRVAGIDGNPNIIVISRGILSHVVWTNAENVIDRTDGPAVVMYDEFCNIILQAWIRQGFIGGASNDFPDVILQGKNSMQKSWHGRSAVSLEDTEDSSLVDIPPHRVNAPATIECDFKGNVINEIWYHLGEVHNPQGPAKIEYFGNGVVKSEKWYRNGKPFRANRRPARISYYESGEVFTEERFRNGVSVSMRYFNKEGVMIHYSYYDPDSAGSEINQPEDE